MDLEQNQELLERLQGMAKQAQFVSFTYRAKESGELARHTLIFGISYTKQIQDSLLALELLRPTFTRALDIEAAIALKKSFEATLEALARGEYNPLYTKPNSYVTISNGLKYNITNRTINASGLAHAKVVLEPGVFPEVKHRPLTIAKDAICKQLSISRWREFILACENLQSARLQGVELVLN